MTFYSAAKSEDVSNSKATTRLHFLHTDYQAIPFRPAMKLGYSEFSFGYAFTENLIRSSPLSPSGAPVFPNLVQEADLGYDVRIDLPGLPWFFQYNLPAVRPNFGPPITRVLRLFHGGGLDAPAWFCSKIGGLLPIAPWGRSSL